jgi:hypothetical protein
MILHRYRLRQDDAALQLDVGHTKRAAGEVDLTGQVPDYACGRDRLGVCEPLFQPAARRTRRQEGSTKRGLPGATGAI